MYNYLLIKQLKYCCVKTMFTLSFLYTVSELVRANYLVRGVHGHGISVFLIPVHMWV